MHLTFFAFRSFRLEASKQHCCEDIPALRAGQTTGHQGLAAGKLPSVLSLFGGFPLGQLQSDPSAECLSVAGGHLPVLCSPEGIWLV